MEYLAHVGCVGCPEATGLSNTGKVTAPGQPLGSAHLRVLGNSPPSHQPPSRQLGPGSRDLLQVPAMELIAINVDTKISSRYVSVYLRRVGYRLLRCPVVYLRWPWLDPWLRKEQSSRITSAQTQAHKVKEIQPQIPRAHQHGCPRPRYFWHTSWPPAECRTGESLTLLIIKSCLCSSTPTKFFFLWARAWDRLHHWRCYSSPILSSRCVLSAGPQAVFACRAR